MFGVEAADVELWTSTFRASLRGEHDDVVTAAKYSVAGTPLGQKSETRRHCRARRDLPGVVRVCSKVFRCGVVRVL